MTIKNTGLAAPDIKIDKTWIKLTKKVVAQ